MKLLLALLPLVALAQLPPNSVTVTASGTSVAPSDLLVSVFAVLNLFPSPVFAPPGCSAVAQFSIVP